MYIVKNNLRLVPAVVTFVNATNNWQKTLLFMKIHGMKSFMPIEEVLRGSMNVKNHLVVAIINSKSVVVIKQPFLSTHQEKPIRNDFEYCFWDPKTIVLTVQFPNRIQIDTLTCSIGSERIVSLCIIRTNAFEIGFIKKMNSNHNKCCDGAQALRQAPDQNGKCY